MGREFSDAQARSPNLVGVGSAKEIAFIAKYFGGSDVTRTAASCVTGRRSNQLNYAPRINQFPLFTYRSFPCPSLPQTSREFHRDRAEYE